MISSLTGFGRSTFTDEAGRVSVELKSVNNRFLQIDLHLPYGYNWATAEVKKRVSKSVHRGKVYLHMEIVDYNPNQDVIINKPLLKKLVGLNKELSEELGMDLPVQLDGLLLLPAVMKVDNKPVDTDETLKRILPVLDEAIKNFVDFRQREGQNMADDLMLRKANIISAVDEIEVRLPEFKESFINKFKERITELAGKADVDDSRMNTEIAIWADKSDVTEELTRLRSHLKEMANVLNSSKPIGRRLDFLVQELNREANTLSSKISDVVISQKVLDIKCEIEKIREQAQNIE